MVRLYCYLVDWRRFIKNKIKFSIHISPNGPGHTCDVKINECQKKSRRYNGAARNQRIRIQMILGGRGHYPGRSKNILKPCRYCKIAMIYH